MFFFLSFCAHRDAADDSGRIGSSRSATLGLGRRRSAYRLPDAVRIECFAPCSREEQYRSCSNSARPRLFAKISRRQEFDAIVERSLLPSFAYALPGFAARLFHPRRPRRSRLARSPSGTQIFVIFDSPSKIINVFSSFSLLVIE